MIRIGLTGSIGMGKSTVLAMFADLGAATWDADAAVHRLYGVDGAAVTPIAEAFPEAVVNGAVDRGALAKIVLADTAALAKLEAMVHPLVEQDRENFMLAAQEAGAQVAMLDIPLLFENGTEKFFDATVVVSAPLEAQRERVLARPGMSEEKFQAILQLQMPDEEKRQRADYIIDTGVSLEETKGQVVTIYSKILDAISTI